MKTVHLLFILCTVLALVRINPTSAHQNQTAANIVARCDVEAYVIDQGETNVRSGPGKTFKTIGNLPNQNVEGIGVHITGASGEWVRIDKAIEQGSEQGKILFQREGWIYARLLGVGGKAITNGGTNLYQQMTEKSPVVIRVPGGDDAVTIKGCRGKWLRVEYKKKTGWAAPGTLCANSLTTCV